jgi:hypothetical protein
MMYKFDRVVGNDADISKKPITGYFKVKENEQLSKEAEKKFLA